MLLLLVHGAISFRLAHTPSDPAPSTPLLSPAPIPAPLLMAGSDLAKHNQLGTVFAGVLVGGRVDGCLLAAARALFYWRSPTVLLTSHPVPSCAAAQTAYHNRVPLRFELPGEIVCGAFVYAGGLRCRSSRSVCAALLPNSPPMLMRGAS